MQLAEVWNHSQLKHPCKKREPGGKRRKKEERLYELKHNQALGLALTPSYISSGEQRIQTSHLSTDAV